MTIPLWCLFLSALLMYVSKLPVAKAMAAEGGYDNHHPRAQQARLTGRGARALAAHQNTLEIFPLFLAGVMVAQITHTQGWLIDGLAVIFVACRVAYILLYLADLARARSLVWALGTLCCLCLMLSPLLR